MKQPSASDLFRALDTTWPPARFINHPPWILREGAGGGQRVSAATAHEPAGDNDIPLAEEGMLGLGQHPLFMIRPGEDALDRFLEARSYEIVDPVAIYVMPADTTVPLTDNTTAKWPPSNGVRDLWENGGISRERIAVMERVTSKKAAIVARQEQSSLGVAFVATDRDIAMLHALEVSPSERRRGIGSDIMQAAITWATENGALWLSLMVTRANQPANALYRRLGMVEVGHYHYRRAPKAKP